MKPAPAVRRDMDKVQSWVLHPVQQPENIHSGLKFNVENCMEKNKLQLVNHIAIQIKSA